MADKKISELDLALQINNDAVFPMSQDNAGEPTTFKAGITQLGTEIAEDMTFSNLQTTSKKLVGAINELLSLGNPIILGTTAPTSSQGANGNIYIQYTEGTGGADDEVDGIYVKIDGAWCEIQTGGGSGTTDYEDLSNKPQVNSVELVGNKSLDDLGIMPASLSKTISGSIASFTDGANNIPVKSLVSQIVAVESGSGTKSPTNPYTISGFANGVVTVCGVNLWNETTKNGYWNTTNGNYVSVSGQLCSNDYIPVKENTAYYFYKGSTTNQSEVLFYDKNKTIISYLNYSHCVNKAFTTPSNCAYITFNLGSSYGTTYLNNISFNYPSTDTQYHAYNGNTYTFTFGQTVYGGHFDNKGNLVVTHKIVDFGDLGYYYLNGRFSSTDIPDVKNVSVWNSALKMCSCYEIAEVQTWTQGDFIIGLYGKNIYVKDSRYTDTVSFKQALTGQKFVVELANPITLAITSQDIPTLLGENNIFSNTGDVEVEYYTDNADEIAGVAKATASKPLHNYSTDEQIVGTWIDGKPLYQKTIVIAGASLTAGQSNAIPHGISDIDYVQLVNGTYTFGDGEAKLPLPFADNYKPVTESVVVIEAISSSTIRIGVGSNYQGAVAPNTVWMTVQYTKTTDFASST